MNYLQILTRSLLAFVLSWAGISSPFSQREPAVRSTASGSNVEEIRVIRSLRTSRIAPTEFCSTSRTGFSDMLYEDQYDFLTVTTREGDGAVVNPHGPKAASLHACFGKTTEANLRSFYGEGEIGGMAFTGNGKCTTVKMDFPEKGFMISSCYLELHRLKDPYVGGLLTTNSLNTPNVLGDVSDPPGYVQPSIATVRLWKKRSIH